MTQSWAVQLKKLKDRILLGGTWTSLRIGPMGTSTSVRFSTWARAAPGMSKDWEKNAWRGPGLWCSSGRTARHYTPMKKTKCILGCIKSSMPRQWKWFSPCAQPSCAVSSSGVPAEERHESVKSRCRGAPKDDQKAGAPLLSTGWKNWVCSAWRGECSRETSLHPFSTERGIIK